ncbi:PRC-barrel domain-containing protein [Jiella sp. M17.18]|uniref:PRC-barrel domain-containing protein n=1 Tax=Jiella sp. M17.18 TaxID=3234247 RepID=UPI0034DFC5BB
MKPILAAAALVLLAGPALAQGTQPGIATGNATSSSADQSGTAGQSGQAGSGAGGSASSAAPRADVLVPIGKDDVPVQSLNLMVGQVDKLQVIGADGSDLGEVHSVLGDQNGQPKAITIDVGGFLGMGQKNIILMLPDVKLDMGKLRTNLTKEQVEKLPDFNG